MERKPPSTLGDFIAIVQRRKYWIIVPSVTVILIALALTPLIPRSYQSTTTILVEPQKIPTEYVRATVTTDVTDRLHTIGLEVMSSTRLIHIINDLNLYPELRKKENINQIVGAMRKDISVDVVRDPTDDGKNSVGAFKISYVGRTPQETQSVTKEMADLFIRENLKERDQQAQGTDAFITAQLAQARQQLAAQDAKIRAFKDAHMGSLPEQEQANLQMVGQYEALLQTNNEAIDRANQQRVYLQSVLNVKTSGNPGTPTPAAPTALQLEIAQKQSELNADLLKYTPEHPDVIRLQHDIAALKLQVQHAPRSSASGSIATNALTGEGPSVTDQLRSQLVSLNEEIRARNARQEQVEQKLKQLQGAVESQPAVQTAFSSLDRDYQEMEKNYNDLLAKQQAASMAAELERHDESEQFIVLDPANLPSKPYRPDPVLIGLGSVLIGLLIGLIFAMTVELRDDTMHDADEVAAYLKLPVIVALPICPQGSMKAGT
jgi:polysaccharide chain length determinant protein (PEP-CTERM system associated)